MIRIEDKREASIYELLDWIETEAPCSIRGFWTCVFTESILTRYPTLKGLQERLFNGQKPAVDIVKGAGAESGFDSAPAAPGRAALLISDKFSNTDSVYSCISLKK